MIRLLEASSVLFLVCRANWIIVTHTQMWCVIEKKSKFWSIFEYKLHMSGEFLFELIEKAQWSFERKLRRKENEQSWTLIKSKFWLIRQFWSVSFDLIFLVLNKWFSSSIRLSQNAQQFLEQIGGKTTPISLHLPYVFL